MGELGIFLTQKVGPQRLPSSSHSAQRNVSRLSTSYPQRGEVRSPSLHLSFLPAGNHHLKLQAGSRPGFPGGSVVKNPLASGGDTGDLGPIPGSGISLEKEMATHSSILAWEIPWTEEPGGLQPVRSQKGQTQLRNLTTTASLIP